MMGAPISLRQSGFGMIEVLVSILIVLMGVLGLAGLIARSQQAEMESYQRVQAIILLQDMVDRLNANRKDALSYKDATAGTGASATCPGGTTAQQDICQWHNALLGVSKKLGGGTSTNNLGAMIDARGCIFELDAANKIYMVSIAWQGMGNTFAPTDIPACGSGLYGAETNRRVLTQTLRIADLAAP